MQASCDSSQRYPRLGDPGHRGLYVQRRNQRRPRPDHVAHQGGRKFTGEESIELNLATLSLPLYIYKLVEVLCFFCKKNSRNLKNKLNGRKIGLDLSIRFHLM